MPLPEPGPGRPHVSGYALLALGIALLVLGVVR